MLAKLKEWGWAVVLAFVGLVAAVLALGKPRWVREKEKEINARDKDIEQSKSQADQTQSDYKGVKAKHDEEINEAGKPQDTKPFTDPDDAASFIDDIISKRQ